MNPRAQLWFLNRWLDHLPCLHMQDRNGVLESTIGFHFKPSWKLIGASCVRCMFKLTAEEARELWNLLNPKEKL
jgi:hypothetical protein